MPLQCPRSAFHSPKNTGASLFLMEVELSCREEKVGQTPQPIWFCDCLVIYNSKLVWCFLVRSILPFWCHKPMGDQPVNGSPGSPETWWSRRWIGELPTTVTFYSLNLCGSIVQWFTYFPNNWRNIPGLFLGATGAVVNPVIGEQKVAFSLINCYHAKGLMSS